MGFYQPAQIIIDARKHGVHVRPVDINYSCWDNTLEEKEGKYFALRLGFRQVKGLRQEDMQLLVAARSRSFTAVTQLKNAGVSQAGLEKLADADAFRSIGLDRRQASWEIAALHDIPVGIFKGQPSETFSENIQLPAMSLPEHVIHDYATAALSLKAHPVSFVREKLSLLHVIPTNNLSSLADGTVVKVAGLVLVRQRPGTASGICFITIEDETGIANLVVFQKLFDQYRKEILSSQLLMVTGKLQKEGEVIHVVVQDCHNLSKLLKELNTTGQPVSAVQTTSRADEKDDTADTRIKQNKSSRKVVQREIFPTARNFR